MTGQGGDVSIEVSVGELEAAGRSARSLAEQIGAVNVASVADEIAVGLPGGTAAVAGDALADRWHIRVRALAGRVDTHAAALAGAVRALAAQNEANADAFTTGPP